MVCGLPGHRTSLYVQVIAGDGGACVVIMLVILAVGSCDEGEVPRISKNGFQQRKSHSVGTIFKYKCNKGYRLVGSSTAYCTPTGWSVGEAPTCASKT